MSLLKSIGKAVGAVARVVAPVAAVVPGGQAIAGVAGVVGRLGARSATPSVTSGILPGGMMAPGMLPTLPALGGAVAVGARAVGFAAGRAMRGAIAWCRRNPAWCSTVGGTAAVASMIENGQLPMPRRRRGRGLSGRDLRGFRRTVRLIRATAGSVGLRGRTRGRSSASSTLIAQN